MMQVNSNASYAPLTEKELAFAQAHKLLEKTENYFSKLLQNQFESPEEEEEARNAFREERTKRIENSHLFTSDFWYARSGIKVITDEDWKANFNQPLKLPRRGYNFNAADNAITAGIGSKVSVDGYVLWVFEYGVGALKKGENPPDFFGETPKRFSSMDSPYTKSFQELLGASASGNATWENDLTSNQHVLSFLQKIGVDTSRDFKINGTVFEVKNGIVQTKNYTKPTESAILGIEGLNKLVLRAYEQNLLYL